MSGTDGSGNEDGAGPDEAAAVAPDAVPSTADAALSQPAIRAALDRVLASPDFVASPRLAAFLRYVVESTLEGRSEAIKGYTIAVEALGRPPSFDPQSDPIVRVEATRLRRALERYYTTAGVDDPVAIEIPKGGYVPLFRPRGEAEAEPDEAPTPAPQPTLPERPAARRRFTMAAAAAVLALLAGAGLYGLDRRDAGREPAAVAADRVRLPLVEVRAFEAVGAGAPSGVELRALEDHMRDAFARFDFAEVKAAGADLSDHAAAQACSGPASRSVFSLAGAAEGRPDGSFSLSARLTDRCDGSIVWSTVIDALAGADRLADSERRVVHEVAVAVMEGYGVVQVRARARALARAPSSGFACIAAAASARRGEPPEGRPVNLDECLAELTRADTDFALGHAVRAEALLHKTLHDDTPAPSEAELEVILGEAERAVALAPASAFAARSLALVQLFAGEPEDAIATAERALKLNPLDFDVAATVGVVFIGAGRVDEGEALLLNARREGAVATPLRDSFLALAAFMRGDLPAAQALVPQLTLHPAVENRLALALCLHALGRHSDERDVVNALVHQTADGAEGVRRLVGRLLPSRDHAAKAIAALESAGLSQEAGVGKPPRG